MEMKVMYESAYVQVIWANDLTGIILCLWGHLIFIECLQKLDEISLCLFSVSKGFSSSTILYRTHSKNCGLWSTSCCQESPGLTLTFLLRQAQIKTRTTATNWSSASTGWVYALHIPLFFFFLSFLPNFDIWFASPVSLTFPLKIHHTWSFVLLLTLDDSAIHLEALQKGCGETASQEVWTHPEVPAFQQAEESLRGHPHSARVRCLTLSNLMSSKPSSDL